MKATTWIGTLRTAPALAALGAALAGCGGDARPARAYGGGYYGDGYYGGPGYYGAPAYRGYDPGPYGRGYGYGYGPRGGYGGGGGGYGGNAGARPAPPPPPSPPRQQNWTQDNIRQHWIDLSKQPR